MRPVLLLLATALLSPMLSFAQATIPAAQEIVRLRHVPASQMLERLQVLGVSYPMTADDRSGSLTINLPATTDIISRERTVAVVRDAAQKMDAPQRPIRLSVYVVQSELLTPDEFLALDTALRTKRLDTHEGLTAKGVVFRKEDKMTNLMIYQVAETQSEARATTRPEPLSLKGRVVPAQQEDGRLLVAAEFGIDAGERPMGNTPAQFTVLGKGVLSPTAPLVMAGGEAMPLNDASGSLRVRHEFMIYLWAAPEPAPGAAAPRP